MLQQESLEGLKLTFASNKYDAKIEDTVQKKQEVDKRMVEMGEVMKMLTLHSSSRVRLGIKKSEAQAKQAAYDARFSLFALCCAISFLHLLIQARI